MDNAPNQGWSPGELIDKQETTQRQGLVKWWYENTSIPDPPIGASFTERDAASKSHLFSTIVFWLLLVFILFIPGCLALPNPYVIYADLGMLVLCIPAIFFNRAQKTTIAGILLTFAFEAALTMVIFTTWPLDEPSIQQYELFAFGELLCVALLPPASVFIVMAYNIAVIIVSLLWQPHDPILDHNLATQLIPMLVRPIGLQLLVAAVPFLFVTAMRKAAKRADRVEVIARLEHELVEQKQDLENGIDQLLQVHVEIANGNLNARAPLSQDNVLWQIARALNTLLVRYQRASQAEQELQRLQVAIDRSVQQIQQANAYRQKPVLHLTKSPLDPLVAALQGQELGSVNATPNSQRPSGRQGQGRNNNQGEWQKP